MASRGNSLVVARGLLIAVASLVVGHGLWGTGSVVVMQVGLVAPQHEGSSQTGDRTHVDS